MRGARVAAALALIIALCAPGATAAIPGLIVKGDPKAWSEVEAAFIKFSKAKSYRGKMTGSSAGTLEAVNPDRFHYVMAFGGMNMESIQVGGDVRFRQGSGPWQCSDRPLPVPASDPTKLRGEVSASKGPAVVVDGVQTQSYTYSYKSAGSGVPANIAITSRLYVAVGTGLPKRVQTLGNNNKVEMQLDYYDYDAHISISLPNCK